MPRTSKTSLGLTIPAASAAKRGRKPNLVPSISQKPLEAGDHIRLQSQQRGGEYVEGDWTYIGPSDKIEVGNQKMYLVRQVNKKFPLVEGYVYLHRIEQR